MSNFDDIINLPIRERIGRAKYVPEEEILELDNINKEVVDTLKSMINGGENV